ncbi:SDR family NAD(P)-dependent oxidoreductase [Amycolatopsis jiangsuensis]|uniref:NAD(P)-dependent dehydrogenase (Short-subunit alcohol dehydrogenase family) n=1 Tax=Amycolatopsis jiangsuensis TaxID=1181879 RepID=A0A840J8L2_9PSEU|nr:SDR family oxidoreductase [Amycolatopsis jiangsuensis]MBB4689707.1 NAD(P)-dependent dehydrogenase (short-subunit alcohol dehydrogenase family) [Amycolatopsis jiangsuensis]
MNIDLTGRTALITGSTAGIGEATAEALAGAGADVVVNGRNADRVAEVARRLGARGIAADVGTAEGVAELVEQLPDVDVLVNNAGIFSPQPVFEIPDAEWQRFYEVNVLSGVRLGRHYAPRMARRGWGRVIFVASDSAVLIPTEMVHYGMTKTAQLALSRGMAQELAGTGVTVNSVLPGPTLTEGVREFVAGLYPDVDFAEAERRFLSNDRPTSLLRRLIRPAEVANLITYVASEQAAATTGGALRTDGGVVPTILP